MLERLGPEVTPAQILDLKVCDPAMGSGAFLVEACRQLADRLVSAWRRTGTMPELPGDEDPVLHARRLIAQRCIYGVDKNPLAVDLARLSMWLVTFAREHPFTFVDHSLRHGDSLVGLSKEQIASLALDVSKGKQIETVRVPGRRKGEKGGGVEARDPCDWRSTGRHAARDLWRDAESALGLVRLLGDSYVAAYFSTKDEKQRRIKSTRPVRSHGVGCHGSHDGELRGMVRRVCAEGARGVPPFHWEAEFPEVFAGKPGVRLPSRESTLRWGHGNRLRRLVWRITTFSSRLS